MAASRAKSGSTPLATSATGRIIRRTASAFTSTRTGTSMKVYGKEISVTVKELTGAMRELANSVVSTQETGLRIKSMEEGPSSTKTEIVTTVTGWPGCLKARVE
jgi:hypothetical protein